MNFAYDRRGRLIREWGATRVPAATVDLRYTYDQVGNRLTKTDNAASPAIVTTYDYDVHDAQWSTKYGTFNNRLMHYDTVQNGATLEEVWLAYNRGGQTKRIVRNFPSGPDPSDYVVTCMQYNIDQQMWLTMNKLASADPNHPGELAYYAYDLRGNTTRVWGDVPQPVKYTYDDLNQMTRLETYRSDSPDWTTDTWPASPGDSDQTDWFIDSATGLLREKWDDAGNEIEYTYTPDGLRATRQWARDASNDLTEYTYDDDTRQLLNIDYPDSTPDVTYTYHHNGMVATVTDATGLRTMNFDGYLQLKNEEYDSSSYYGDTRLTIGNYDFVEYQLDVGGGQVLVGDATFGRLASLSFGTDADPNTDYYARYTYDDDADRMATVHGPGLTAGGVEYVYLSDTNLLRRTKFLDSGGGSLGQQIRDYDDDRPLLTSIEARWDGTNQAKCAYRYDDLGRRTDVVYTGDAFDVGGTPNPHFDAWDYNTRDELTDTDRFLGSDPDVTSSPDNDFDRRYDYDPIGNRTDSSDGAANRDYTANSLNQYDKVHTTLPSSSRRFEYDEDGNLTAAYIGSDIDGDGDVDLTDLSLLAAGITDGATCSDTKSLSAAEFERADVNEDCVLDEDDQDALLGQFGLEGQPPHLVYSWDAENRLTRVAPASPKAGIVRVDFGYDYRGRRVEKKVTEWDPNAAGWASEPTRWTRWLYYDWLPIVELDVDPSTQALTITKKFTWGVDLSGRRLTDAGGIGGLLATCDTAGTSTTADDVGYLHFYDGNGNTALLLDHATDTVAARYAYDAYGNELLDDSDPNASGPYAATNSFRFSTKYWDAETGLGHWGYRYYDAKLGRWISRDPAGEDGGRNIYGYAANLPTGAFDPLGLDYMTLSGPYGPSWNPRKLVCEILFTMDFWPSWYDYIANPFYTGRPSKTKAFPLANLGKNSCNPQCISRIVTAAKTGQGNGNYYDPMVEGFVHQLRTATAVQSALVEGYNQSTITRDGLLASAVFAIVLESSRILGFASEFKPAQSAGAASRQGSSAGESSRVLQYGNDARVQKLFSKHGPDFGLSGNWNPARATEVRSAVNSHINSASVRAVSGTYRGQNVTHYVNPTTGVNVIADTQGNFIGGWKLGPGQLQSVLSSGRLY